MMDIALPHAGIILLVGPSNSGKSTFLEQAVNKQEVLPSEIVSSDMFRSLVGDTDFIDWKNRPKDEADSLFETYQDISKEAFVLMDAAIEARCRLNKHVFVDATHLYSEDRQKYVALAKKHHVPIVALVFDIPEAELVRRDEERQEPRGKRRVRQQFQAFKREKRFIKKERFMRTWTIKETDEPALVRLPSPITRDIGAGIDIIGDIHGCFDELIALLTELGYTENEAGLFLHPDGRTFVSIGDVMSRGPKSLETLQFFLTHTEQGLAGMIDSNHGWKIARWLDGRRVTLSHGDEKTAAEFEAYEAQHGAEKAQELKAAVKDMLLNAPSHYVFAKNGVPTLVCTHAGIRDEFIGKQSAVISDFCRYGDTAGFDADNKPIRNDWTVGHNTSLLIVWGHDPRPHPLIINNTINIDQGAVFGGALTAYRYPEGEFVSVDAEADHSGTDDNPLAKWEQERLAPPDIAKFINGYSVLTEEAGEVRIPQELVIPAIDTVSHFTVPLGQLVYIPPTMSPTPETSALDGFLEHPAEAIRYYRNQGVQTLIAEKKHMGSRAILLLFKNRAAARKLTGVDSLGTIYTRTGRRFFDKETEQQLIGRLNEDLRDYFERHDTEFVLLDAEIMPWNLKAKELISSQYAHVAENALLDRKLLTAKLTTAAGQSDTLAGWLSEYEEKLESAEAFKDVFQKYCWEAETIDDIQIAPFHVLAHSGQTLLDRSHVWHMERNREFAELSPLCIETEYRIITDEASEADVISWWEAITEQGDEGIVIKPETFTARNKGKLIQPAIKVRGRKYLRIIYGMDYLEPANLERLKKRNTGKKQKLALREFALGTEGIRRLVNGEPLERVHECVLGALALESDAVDPRL